MRVLVIDQEVMALDFVLRASRAGHEVRWFRYSTKPLKDGVGFKGFRIVEDWRPHMGWARDGLILTTGNWRYTEELDRYRDLGFKIFSPTAASAKLEIDREAGQEAFRAAGIDFIPYETFDSLQAARNFATKHDETYVHKPMGDEADKSLTYVAHDQEDLCGWLDHQIRAGKKLKGKCMLQQKVDLLCELGVSGWFGPEGFLEDKWQVCVEHKNLMDGEVGPATGEMGCYSADTEVLTNDGWKFWPEVSSDDELATLVGGALHFEKPTAVVCYDAQATLVHWQNRSIDILVTPNHNMYVAGQSSARRKCPNFKFEQASNCIESQYLLSRTAEWHGVSPDFYLLPGNRWHTGMGWRSTEDVTVPFRAWAKFLGLWFAEGSTTRSSAHIAQSHPAKAEKAGAIIHDTGLPFTGMGNGFVIRSTNVARELRPFGRSYEKRVPDYIKDAAAEDISAFLDGFALGDAHTQSNGSRYFYTSNKGLADDLQELMLRVRLVGIIRALKLKERFGAIDGRPIIQRRQAYVVYERARKTRSWLDSRDKKEVAYVGKVYCATVSSHVLFVRRNGKPVWCGNTVCQYVAEDKLASEFLKPLEPTLRALGHRGDFAVGCGIDKRGRAWPFEFTTRLGWPAFFIQVASHKGDPVQWMRDLLDGKDSLKVSYDAAIGVVMGQPRFPYNSSPAELVEGNPIRGVEEAGDAAHLVSVMCRDGKFETSGEYVMVMTGLGKTITTAQNKVYRAVDAIRFPNRMYRTDIGDKVIDALPKLHQFGYLKDMRA